MLQYEYDTIVRYSASNVCENNLNMPYIVLKYVYIIPTNNY